MSKKAKAKSKPPARSKKAKANGAIKAKPHKRVKETQVRLPGVSADAQMERYARNVADIRDEAGELQGAHKRMRQLGKVSWRAAGVEFVRVPGEEKLRVRTSKEASTAETEPDEDAPASDGIGPDDDREEFDEDAQEQIQ